ncbi:hypothetical protein [Desulfosporosinus metallidurans]|uniref:hypothetical protein n=1 Tax=Desulfosporosinus metallidurans TaxID=1888891 RepID=UPI00094D0D11|nr:hypothetical protein [Desulfosporosinus metallidurans]
MTVKLGKWDLGTPAHKNLVLFTSEIPHQYLIQCNKNNLAEVTYNGADIVITLGEAKVTIIPEVLSIQITSL